MVAKRSIRASARNLFASALRANHRRSGAQVMSQTTDCTATPSENQPTTLGISARGRDVPAKMTASARLLTPIVIAFALVPAVEPKT